MRSERPCVIDDHVVLACSVNDALACLNGDQSISSWFAVRRDGSRATLRGPTGQFEFCNVESDWSSQFTTLSIRAASGPVYLDGYLTIRGVLVGSRSGGVPREGTEVWVHLELAPQRRTGPLVAAVRDVVRSGLQLICREFDSAPRSVWP